MSDDRLREAAAVLRERQGRADMALADWLDLAADDHDAGCPSDCPAIRVADAILGGGGRPMNDHQTRTLADALAGAEIVRVEELNGSGEWVDITRPKERPMTDHLDRAAEIIAPVLLRDYGMQYDTSHVTADEFMDLARDAARVLDEAGLLASPKRDAAAAAKVLREAARTLNNPSITPEIKSAVDAIFYLFDRADRVEREAQG